MRQGLMVSSTLSNIIIMTICVPIVPSSTNTKFTTLERNNNTFVTQPHLKFKNIIITTDSYSDLPNFESKTILLSLSLQPLKRHYH